MLFGKKINKYFICKVSIFLLLILASTNFVYAESGVPSIISYQGHLSDSGGNLLGGAGTPYYFKFSFWDSATVGAGTKLWPSSAPTATSLTVRQGVFSVNIGDVANDYPDTLDYDFNTNKNIYLQVEISSDNSTFETLSPRSSITASAFSKVTERVSGTAQSSFGTTTPITNSLISAITTGINQVAMTIKGLAGQVANLFNIQDSSGNSLFTVTAGGNVGIGTTTPSAKLDIFDNTLAGSGSLAGSALNIAQTWNTSGTPTALKLNVTDTTSAAGSMLIDLQAGGSSKFKLVKNTNVGYYLDTNGVKIWNRSGNVGIMGSGGTGFNGVEVSNFLGFSNSSGTTFNAADTYLHRDNSSNIIGQRNGTTAQNFRIYNTYTNVSNYERAIFGWTSNALNIGTENAGTGLARALNFLTGSTTRMTIDTSGNVGVGTTTPSVKLDLYGTSGSADIFRVSSSTNARLFTIGANGNVTAGSQTLDGVLTFSSNGSDSYPVIRFPNSYSAVEGIWNDVNNGITFVSGGNSVKIHTGNVYVPGTAGLGYQWKSGASVVGYLQYVSSGKLETQELGVTNLTTSGNLGIGTTTPAFPLDVYSTVSSDQTYGFLNSTGTIGTSAGTNSYSIRSQGRILAPEFNAVSDARLKDVQFELDSGMALNLVTQLKPVSFKWKSDPDGQPVLGFLAQDVEQIIPNAVSKVATANFSDQRTLDYNQLISVVIGAIKDLALKVANISKWFSVGGDQLHIQGEVCVDDICVSKDQFKQILIGSGGSASVVEETSSVVVPTETSTTTAEETISELTPVSEPEVVAPEVVPEPTPEPTPVETPQTSTENSPETTPTE